MNLVIPNHRAFVCGSLAAFLLGMPCSADFVMGGTSISVTCSAGVESPTNSMIQITPTTWSATGSWSTPTASVSWMNNTFGWNNTSQNGFANGNITVRNNTSAAQDFDVVLNMGGTAGGPLSVSGSIGGQFVNGSTSLGSVTSVGPLWQARVDNSVIRSELNNALFFAQPFQVISLGNFNFTNLLFDGSVGSSVALQFSLRLSAGGEASFTSTMAFQSVPTPGVTALIALAGGCGTSFTPVGRRRRSIRS
jgi:hypothetical protein